MKGTETTDPFDAIDEEWRTVSTQLAGWANRATQMRNLAKRYRDALEKIAEGPGTNSEHRERARKALAKP